MSRNPSETSNKHDKSGRFTNSRLQWRREQQQSQVAFEWAKRAEIKHQTRCAIETAAENQQFVGSQLDRQRLLRAWSKREYEPLFFDLITIYRCYIISIIYFRYSHSNQQCWNEPQKWQQRLSTIFAFDLFVSTSAGSILTVYQLNYLLFNNKKRQIQNDWDYENEIKWNTNFYTRIYYIIIISPFLLMISSFFPIFNLTVIIFIYIFI